MKKNLQHEICKFGRECLSTGMFSISHIFLKIQQDYAIIEICHRSSDDLIDSERIILYFPGGSIISFEIKCTSVRCYQNSQGCEVLMKYLFKLYIQRSTAGLEVKVKVTAS